MDKDQERRIVRAIYGDRRTRLTDAESPDFLCVRARRTILGVEVTDYYVSESDARLRNIKDYALELLTSGRLRHKDDAYELPVERVTYMPQGDPSKGREINAIARRTTIQDRLNRFAALIRDKSAKCARYLQNAPQVDLVINDPDSVFHFAKFSELYKHLGRDPVRSAVRECDFREVFLVTDGPEQKRMCIPLRAHVFLEEVMIWERLALSPDRLERLSSARALHGLVAALAADGFGKARLRVTRAATTFSWASVEYSYRKGRGKHIQDRTLPRPGRPIGTSLEMLTKELKTCDLEWGNEFSRVRQEYRSSIDIFFKLQPSRSGDGDGDA